MIVLQHFNVFWSITAENRNMAHHIFCIPADALVDCKPWSHCLLIDSSRPRPHWLCATSHSPSPPPRPLWRAWRGHVRQAMTHMLTLHCSAQAAADSGPASSRGPIARDWLGAMPAGLDPVSCSGRAPASPLVMSYTLTRHCWARPRSTRPASIDGPFAYLLVSIIRLSSRRHSDHTKLTHNHRLTHSSL